MSTHNTKHFASIPPFILPIAMPFDYGLGIASLNSLVFIVFVLLIIVISIIIAFVFEVRLVF